MSGPQASGPPAAADPGILVRTEGTARIIEIDRPRSRNALTPDMLARLRDAVAEADAAPGLRLVVLRGRGDGPFSSGYDLGALPEDRALSPEEVRALLAPIRRLTDAIAACRLPVLGVARRYAIGAAFDVFAHCDLRVADDGARFALPAAQLGFAYPLEGVARLQRTLGSGLTERLLLLAETLPAATLLQTGFLHRTVPAEGLDGLVEELAGRFNGLAPLAVAGLKQGLRAAEAGGPAFDAAADAFYRTITHCMNSEDAREGPAATREKRPPRFTGR